MDKGASGALGRAFWFAGRLFTIAFAQLAWWKMILGIGFKKGEKLRAKYILPRAAQAGQPQLKRDNYTVGCSSSLWPWVWCA